MPWGKAAGALRTAWQTYQEWRSRRKEQRRRKRLRLASDLDRIRDAAGTKARWESPLSDQARAARDRAKKK